ncbi:MAG: carbohydrate-binding family 9-like protein [Candidatus Sumerlaeia bacterium]
MRNLICMLMILCLASACAPAGKHSAAAAGGYVVKYARVKPEFNGDWEAYWNSPAWRQANTVSVDEWSTHSTATRPRARARVLYDEAGIRLLWKVEDTYVVATHSNLQGRVSRDSCVEFFVEPTKPLGYTSFEINAGGTYLWKVHRPADDVRVVYPPTYKAPEAPTTGSLMLLKVRHSMPASPIYPPIERPTTWYVELFIPIEALGSVFPVTAEDLPGAHWRCNFFKVIGSAEDPAVLRHKHYGSWKPIGIQLNFHQPAKFGDLYFEKKS